MRYWESFFWLALGGLGGFTVSFFAGPSPAWRWILIGGGMVVFLIVSRIIDRYLQDLSMRHCLIVGLGLLSGLAVMALSVSILRPFLDILLPRERAVFYGWLSLSCCGGILMMLRLKWQELNQLAGGGGEFAKLRPESCNQLKVLDTSAIIDGRIADLCKTGFLEGVLIIPNFILTELQKIADSAEPLRRNRGRRGLDLLHQMQKENQVVIKILDRDDEELTEVDTKLLRLARELGAKVVTNDYNLNKVAELYGVQVLNINDLSNAIKPIVIPGEEMLVHVLRDGKEYGQGIGYLEDGTMIVVEGGKSYIGTDIVILVTSVLQTSAGRMIFAKPKEYLYSKAVL